MEFCRTTDLELVKRILTTPDVYEHMMDDYAPAREAFQVNEHPDIWYVVAACWSSLVGLFILIPEGVCFKLHLCMLPDATSQEKWEAARGIVPWLSERTHCKRLVAEAPRSNKPAMIFCTHGIGMKYVGIHEKAYMKYGKLQDLIVLGKSINGSNP